MAETTLEIARRCPRCEQPGLMSIGKRLRDGSTLNNVTCHNSRCKWFETSWVVQVNADGTIPETTNRNKDFPHLPDRTEAVQRQLNALYNQTLEGGETRR